MQGVTKRQRSLLIGVVLGIASAWWGCGSESGGSEPRAAAKVEPRSDPGARASVQRPEPLASDHGRVLYARMCAVCHGARGEGYRADNAPGLAHPEFLASVSDEALAVAIMDGRAGTTMSAWHLSHGGPLSDRDVVSLIEFLRTWSRAAPAALDASPPRGEPAAGRRLFAKECARCHDPAGPYVRITSREWLSTATPGFLRHALRVGRVGTPMASFADLGERAIEDLVAYLTSLPAWPTPQPPPLTARPPPLPLGPVPLNPRGPSPRGFAPFPRMTSVDVVHAQLARGARMVLIDARVPSDFVQLRIEGAVSVPFYDPAPYFAALPKDTWLVCYCGCPHAESGALAEQLVAAGFRKVTVLDEGLGEWLARGYPVHSGGEH
ncbi:MAG: c-type cytochrome [Myxococcales bacterium]